MITAQCGAFGVLVLKGITASWEDFCTNKRSLELQLMRKLSLSRYLNSVQLPVEYQDKFKDLICNPFASEEFVIDSVVSNASGTRNLSTVTPVTGIDWSVLTDVALPSVYRLQVMESEDLDALFIVNKSLYPDQPITRMDMSKTIKVYSTVMIGSHRFSSKMECRSLRSSRIYASWTAKEGDLNLTGLVLWAGCVLCYFSHSIKWNGKFVGHVFARVLWHKADENPDHFGNPTKTWKLNDHVPNGPSRFLPVQRIYCRYAAAEIEVDGEKKVITVAMDRIHPQI